MRVEKSKAEPRDKRGKAAFKRGGFTGRGILLKLKNKFSMSGGKSANAFFYTIIFTHCSCL
jgi:hypothetical protein